MIFVKILEKLIKIFKPPVTRRVKIFESANLELAYVSSGRLDAYINPDDKIWDMIGGSQIIKNAGLEAAVVVNEIMKSKKSNGFDARIEKLVDMIKF